MNKSGERWRRFSPATARRLYEEAFGAGAFSVIDEVVGEEFCDHIGQRRGPDGFKRAITSLHHTFPDLHASVEKQSTRGDTVTTHCVFRGTDKGGVCCGTRRPANAPPS